MAGSERRRELRRRRHRKKQVAKLLKRASSGDAAVKATVATKLRRMTPGANVLIAAHGIEG